ncbi:hybrid sensor histidine kinase/response regulator [Xanthocytophaga agilis]|uniref:histidine kinase n=1 Tax=Xanthocytophaga agilis TaxID=3048010 RepID=A0AAE3R0X7_9BACT|nr:7TM diverse intracellular signaling domain-containing protein [Xanthocytophaga agilis]MDJ1501095.1 7TM diverse intracellular signaling domain-containing protein [Xanthocytophaga agilis]
MRIFIYSIVVWIFQFFLLPISNAQNSLKLQNDSVTYNLNPYLKMLKDKNRSLSITQIQSPVFQNRFIAHPNYSLGFSQAGYWLRFTILSPPDKNWILSIHNPLLVHAKLYIPQRDSGFQVQEWGSQTTKLYSYKYPIFSIKPQSATPQTYYLYVWGDGPLDLPVLIESETFFQKKDHIEQFWQGIFYGILFVMAVYNFILYVFLRDLSYLYYVLYLILIAFFLLSLSGYGNEWLWSSPSWWSDRAVFITGSLTAIMIVIFCLQFLHLRKTLPAWYKIGRYFIIVTVVEVILGAFLLDLSLNMLLLTITAAIFVIIILSISIKSYQNGNLSAGYLLLAWTVMLISVGIAVLNAFGLIPSNTFTLKSLQIGSVTDVILISLALVDRIHSIQMQKIQIEQEKNNAEHNQKVKEEILATMSHEIRTPLNAVIGFAKLLEKTNTTQTQSDYIRHIHESAENLLVLINDILDLSKINAGKVTFEQVEINLQECVRHLFETLQFQVTEKKLEMIADIQEDVPTLFLGDPVRLNQILLNLLSNAVKFTPKGSVTLRIRTLKLEKQQIALLFEVEDTGIGIPANRLSSIFEGFTQASDQTTRMYGGTGLGLAIVKQLVEMQGGNIAVKSQLGVGSVFSVALPFYRVYSVAEKNETVPASFPQTPLVLLIIDDNPLNRLIAQSTVHNASSNAKAELAGSGQEGIELLQKTEYHAVLIDLQMPDMDGYEVARHIRTHLPDKQHIPLIAMTASLDDRDHEQALAAGMHDIVTKPFEAGVLFKKIFKLRANLQNPGNEPNQK